ncbi:MAG: iron ABC transporter permease [Chloroflexota bacterium]|nr:iron ABC transporter permease [Chloroflexota bacterium]
MKLSFNTVSLILLVVIFSILISLPLAFLNVRSNMPFAKYLTSISVLPIALPSYVMATTQIEIWSKNGWVHNFLQLFFEMKTFPSFYGLVGSVFVLSLITYPYVYIGLAAMFRRFDYQMIDASRTLGDSSFGTFRKIIFPLVKPTIVAGSLLVSLYVLSDFGAVSLLRFNTFTIAIFNRMYNSISNYGVLEISLLAILFCFLILFIESKTKNEARYFSNSNLSDIKKIDLGIWKWILFPISLIPLIFGFILPISVLIYWFIIGFGEDTGFRDVIQPTINTIIISSVSAFFITLVSIPLLITIRKNIRILSFMIDKVSYIGLSLPGVIVSMSLVFFCINYFDYIYQTFIVLVLGYFISFLPAALGPIKSSMTQIDPKLEDASFTLGAGKIKTYYNIVIKLASPGFIYGGVLVFILCLKELPATLILSPIGFQTLATEIWSNASEAFFIKTALASIVLVIIAGIPSYIFMSNDLSKRLGN